MNGNPLMLFLTATLALSTGDKVESATKESVVSAAKVVSQVSLGANETKAPAICDGVLDIDFAWICKQAPEQCRCRGSDQCKCDKKPVDTSGNRCIPCFYSLHLCVCYP